MLLIDAVETWPTSILTIIFTFDSHMPFALSQLETVIAYFFGNGIPLQTAFKFFAECSGHPYVLVSEQFSYLYELWSHLDRKPRRYNCRHYYNMRERKFKYIDGSYMNEYSSITTETGFEGTCFPTIIRSILRRLCHVKMENAE